MCSRNRPKTWTFCLSNWENVFLGEHWECERRSVHQPFQLSKQLWDSQWGVWSCSQLFSPECTPLLPHLPSAHSDSMGPPTWAGHTQCCPKMKKRRQHQESGFGANHLHKSQLHNSGQVAIFLSLHSLAYQIGILTPVSHRIVLKIKWDKSKYLAQYPKHGKKISN